MVGHKALNLMLHIKVVGECCMAECQELHVRIGRAGEEWLRFGKKLPFS